MINKNLIKLKIFLISIMLVTLNSCVSHKYFTNQELEGTYIQKDDKGIELQIGKTSFVLMNTYKQEHLPPFKCCDTIAYGGWKRDKKESFLELNSPENLNTFYVGINVQEENILSNNMITFIIDNPIEKHYKKYNEKYRELFYDITITTDDDLIYKTSDKNPIKIEKKRKILEFEITIYPKYNIPIRNISAREVYTIPYQVKNPNANVFKIDVPQLDYGYLSYKRLNNDYVKIINKKKLLWDGKEYIKK
jgi:hypothetical protein